MISGLASTVYSWAWCCLLTALESARGRPDRLLLIYAKSQLWKYIPGNVAQIAGRHVVSRADGYGHGALTLSTLYELIGLLSAAGLVSSLTLGLSNAPILAQFPLIYATSLLACGLPTFYLLHCLLSGSPLLRKLGPAIDARHIQPLVIVPCVYYLVFFLLAGSALALQTWPFGHQLGFDEYLLIGFAFAASWTLGVATPGAPSGIGVREAVLVFILSPLVGTPHAILLSILFRVVTVGGDLLFWILMEAWALRRAPAH